MAPNTPAPLIQVTNMVNFVGCNEGTWEPCVPWRIILLPHTIGLSILRLIIISTTSNGQYPINPAHYRTVWLVPDTGSGGADDLVSSVPRTELIKIPLANFNVLREQAALGETVINGSGPEDQLSIKSALCKIHCTEEWETVEKRLLFVDESTTGAVEIYTVISKILASLPDVENNGNLPGPPDVVNAVAGAIEDVVEGLNTQRASDVVAKAQMVPASEILGAPLEVAVSVTAQA